MGIIEVEGLVKRYGGRAALDGVSFEVGDGEIFGILGPNGAGKTTAVECLEGLRRPDAGRVRVLGLDPRADGDRLRERIGVQLQQTGLPASIRVREALELYASFYRSPRDPGELLAEWDLEDKRRARVRRLSGGQAQRLHIALALVGRPDLVFLDEPTTGLDPQARRAAWNLIRRVRDGGVTVVLISHFMDEAEELCDRLAVFDRGRVAASGTPEALIEQATGGGGRMRFRPSAEPDLAELAGLPGVTGVARSGRHVVVDGTGDFAAAVASALARRHVLVADLRVEQTSLDDAYVALTGGPPAAEPDGPADPPARPSDRA
ncbi:MULTISPECIES: ABC transporter ATP-binding protein [Actinomadura]|uniref:ABC transporter ATP-binding protein n=1 Tax=Actinomadura TaxID=1988 RepID=UPI000407370E|nr:MULTISPECIES: ABC transporter ATP-binding protein [Actinomadura]RSN68274.1 ABC transporter ATP-binding protein [Actinomadura sp. WAC 06369]